MRYAWLKSRQTKYTSYATVYILAVLLALGAVNFLANRYDKSYDATANKQFSLSDQTEKIVKGLTADVTLTYFGDTANFPGARDVLDQYAKLSPKVHSMYLDPVRKPQQAKSAGYRSDSQLVVASAGREEGAKSLTEQEITGAIIRARKTGERNVCFLGGAGEHSIDDTGDGGFSDAKQIVEQDNYKTRTIAPKGAAPEAGKAVNINQNAAATFDIPKECTVVVAGGPQTDYPPTVVGALKSYVEGGGRAMIMLDETLRLGRSSAASENADLVKLLADWGVTVNKDLTLDLSGIGQLFGLGYEVPLVVEYGSHPITAPLSRLPTAFPLVRSLEIKSGDKTTVDGLLNTTEDSIATSDVGSSGAVDPKKGKKGPITLAAVGTYSGTPPGRFAVFGTSEWAENGLLGSRRIANADLFANTVNWLSSDEDLISIRPKETEDRPLNLTSQRMFFLKWLSIAVFPLAVVLFGLGTWWKRR